MQPSTPKLDQLKPSKSKPLKLMAICGAFVAGAIFTFQDSPGIAILALALFGGGFIYLLAHLIIGKSPIEIYAEGLLVRRSVFSKGDFIHWNSIERISASKQATNVNLPKLHYHTPESVKSDTEYVAIYLSKPSMSSDPSAGQVITNAVAQAIGNQSVIAENSSVQTLKDAAQHGALADITIVDTIFSGTTEEAAAKINQYMTRYKA